MDKDAFHRTYRRTLKQLAAALGLQPGTFEVRSNKAGPAIPGEITLHADNFYVQVGGLDQETVLYRTCTSRKDYVGGYNRYMDAATLRDLPQAVRLIRNLTGPHGALP